MIEQGNSLWRPTASRANLAQRARIIAELREFFVQRQLLEVETPLLCASPPPESHLEPISCGSLLVGDERSRYYLHTSPETPMKRLLAAGCGDIFQICKAFRHGETGPWHNPEFTILEWYRMGWDYRQLMDEVFELVASILPLPEPVHLTVSEAFAQWVGPVDPLTADEDALIQAARLRGQIPPEQLGREELVDFLLATLVEPGMRQMGGAVFLRDYPVARAAMAEIALGPPPFARRFELYLHGVELANGYQELIDPHEQAQRLAHADQQRRQKALPALPGDPLFLAAMEAGLPPCAGVALGVDRLIMLTLNAASLREVIAFPVDRI